MFLEAATHKNISAAHVFSFRRSGSLIYFRSSRTFFKNIEKHLRAARQSLQHKKIYSEAAAEAFTVSEQNIHNLCEDFS